MIEVQDHYTVLHTVFQDVKVPLTKPLQDLLAKFELSPHPTQVTDVLAGTITVTVNQLLKS